MFKQKGKYQCILLFFACQCFVLRERSKEIPGCETSGNCCSTGLLLRNNLGWHWEAAYSPFISVYLSLPSHFFQHDLNGCCHLQQFLLCAFACAPRVSSLRSPFDMCLNCCEIRGRNSISWRFPPTREVPPSTFLTLFCTLDHLNCTKLIGSTEKWLNTIIASDSSIWL